jgi:hypothetical protein
MTWRGLAALLLLAAVGGVAGYAVADLRDPEPTTASTAEPLPAESPSFPVEPERPFAKDIDYPALQPGLEYRSHRIGDPPFMWTYDVPRGWKIVEDLGPDEIRWRPPDEPDIGGYSMRVKLTTEHKTKQQMVDQKLAAMQSSFEDVEILGQTDDLLSFSYRDSPRNTQRFNTFGWFSLPGEDEAKFEMSVVGRSVDRPGLEELFDRVSASIAKVP